jgi:hypothetical protein
MIANARIGVHRADSLIPWRDPPFFRTVDFWARGYESVGSSLLSSVEGECARLLIAARCARECSGMPWSA